MIEDSIFDSISKRAAMRKRAWTTLEDVLRPLRNAKQYGIEERIRRSNEHLRGVVGSGSYPSPITDAMIDQALALAREGFAGSMVARIVDPRIR